MDAVEGGAEREVGVFPDTVRLVDVVFKETCFDVGCSLSPGDVVLVPLVVGHERVIEAVGKGTAARPGGTADANTVVYAELFGSCSAPDSEGTGGSAYPALLVDLCRSGAGAETTKTAITTYTATLVTLCGVGLGDEWDVCVVGSRWCVPVREWVEVEGVLDLRRYGLR